MNAGAHTEFFVLYNDAPTRVAGVVWRAWSEGLTRYVALLDGRVFSRLVSCTYWEDATLDTTEWADTSSLELSMATV